MQEYSNSATDSSPASQPSTSVPTAHQQQQLQHQQFLGDASAAIPDFGHIELSADELLSAGLTSDHLLMFQILYKDHCEVWQ